MDETRYKIKVGLTILWIASLFGISLTSAVILKNGFSTDIFGIIQFLGFITINISSYVISIKMNKNTGNNEN